MKAKEKLATLQRDSRPLLYRFHEVYTLYCIAYLYGGLEIHDWVLSVDLCMQQPVNGLELTRAHSPLAVLWSLQGFTNAVKRPMLVRDFL